MPIDMTVTINQHNCIGNIQKPSARVVRSELEYSEAPTVHKNNVALDGILDVCVSSRGIVSFVWTAPIDDFRRMAVNMDFC